MRVIRPERTPGPLVTVVVTVIVALAAMGLPGCGDADRFYLTPDGLRDGQAGSLLRSESMFVPGAGQRGWRILYQSTGLDGRPVAVSGSFVRPSGPAPAGGFPLISYAHPTVGIADACAPSKRDDTGVLTSRAVAAGFAVVLTDYQGLGTAGVHPYLIGESEGRSVLDAARAVRTLGGAEVGDQLGVWGYSQGGHAAMFAAQIASSYAPDLNLFGTVSVAGVASDHWVADVLRRPDLYALGVMAAVSWAANADPGTGEVLHAEDVLGPIGRDATPRLLGTDVDRPAVCSDLGGIGIGHSSAELINADPSTLPAWRAALDRVAVGGAAPSAPLLVISGTSDDLVPPSEAEFARRRYCARGADVEVRAVPGANHLTIMDTALDVGLTWMVGRLSGAATTSSC